MTMILDIHHHGTPLSNAVTAIDPGHSVTGGFLFSVGLHPWNSTTVTADMADVLAEAASATGVVAIGETGIDRLRGAAVEVQTDIFITHVGVAERFGLPVIIHCVRAIDLILGLHRRLRPTTPWAIHGFRGNPTTASQLTRAGIYVSLGAIFNIDTAATVDPRYLLAETDESPQPVTSTIDTLAAARHTDPETMTALVADNTARFLFGRK